MTEDIRWKQRLANLNDAWSFLRDGLTMTNPSPLERSGIIKSFEFTFELGWKTLKDLLNEKGVEVKFPREVIKEAFSAGLIEDGAVWMDMLDKRNLMAHTYNEKNAKLAFRLISEDFAEPMAQLVKKLNEMSIS